MASLLAPGETPGQDPGEAVAAALNAAQQRAALSRGRRVRVLAGPGNGKTETLVTRHKVLRARGIRPEAILVTTFTTQAAEELRERLGEGAVVATLHSFAAGILRECRAQVGDFTIIEPETRLDLLREAQRQVPGAESIPLERIAQVMDRWQEHLLDPEAVSGHLAAIAADGGPALDTLVRGQPVIGAVLARLFETALGERNLTEHQLVLKVYRHYRERLDARKALDFPSLIATLIDLTERDHELATRLAHRFAHVLVDEYQDVNLANVRLLDLLIAGPAHLWVVGDDDQALYSFRGASVLFILSFEQLYPGAETHILEVNYRSTPLIVAASAKLIANNRNRVPKPQQAARGGSVPIQACMAVDDLMEADWLASALKTIHEKHDVAWRDMAVLVRISALADPLLDALRYAGIPFDNSDVTDFWSRPAPRLLLTTLMAAGGSGTTSLDVASVAGLPFEPAVQAVLGLVLGYLAETGRGRGHVARARQAARQLCLAGSFSRAEALLSTGRGGEGVTVSTLHGAKGRQWEAVFLPGWEEGILPHRYADVIDDEEERRDAYVGLSRARRVLGVSMSLSRNGSRTVPSRFLHELVEGLPPQAFAWKGRADVLKRYEHPGRREASAVSWTP